MKLKIISDGTTVGTKLINEETGEMIHYVQKITWEVNAQGAISKATIELAKIPIEVVVDSKVE